MPLQVCPCPAPLLSSLTDPPLFFTYASHAFQSPVLYDASADVPAFLPAKSNVSCKAHPSHLRKLPDSPFGRRTPHSKQDHCTGGPTFPPEQALEWENLSARGGNSCPLSESRGPAVRGPILTAGHCVAWTLPSSLYEMGWPNSLQSRLSPACSRLHPGTKYSCQAYSSCSVNTH